MITLLNKFDDGYVMNKSDVDNVTSSIIRQNNLDDYYRETVFKPIDKFLSYYHLVDKDIVYDDVKIIKDAYNLYDIMSDDYDFDENLYSYVLNFCYMYIIHHEIDHIEQLKRYTKPGSDNIFKSLYLFNNSLKQDKELYEKYHDLFPMEKDAINVGSNKAYQIMCHTKLPKRECNIIYLFCLIRQLENYNQEINGISSPMSKLLEISNTDIKPFDESINVLKFPIGVRLNYGLDITQKEFDYLKTQKKKLCKKINNSF